MNRTHFLIAACVALAIAGCSSNPAETATAQDEAALKSGTGAKPPEGFKAPGSDGAAPTGAPGPGTTG